MTWLFEFLGLLFACVSIIVYFIGRHQGENTIVSAINILLQMQGIKGKIKREKGKLVGFQEVVAQIEIKADIIRQDGTRIEEIPDKDE